MNEGNALLRLKKTWRKFKSILLVKETNRYVMYYMIPIICEKRKAADIAKRSEVYRGM